MLVSEICFNIRGMETNMSNAIRILTDQRVTATGTKTIITIITIITSSNHMSGCSEFRFAYIGQRLLISINVDT